MRNGMTLGRNLSVFALAVALDTVADVQTGGPATIPSERAVFKKGTSSTTLKGRLDGRAHGDRDYVLNAKAGQTMKDRAHHQERRRVFQCAAAGE
jgi:hypothetical protein